MGYGEYDWRPLERERVQAFMRRDAQKYALLCYELGIEPEDKELYDQGALPEFNKDGGLERLTDEDTKELRPRKRTVSNSVYSRFLDESSGLSENIFKDTGTKARLLLEYFPMRGDTEDMTPRQIGSKFNRMRSYAKRRIQ